MCIFRRTYIKAIDFTRKKEVTERCPACLWQAPGYRCDYNTVYATEPCTQRDGAKCIHNPYGIRGSDFNGDKERVEKQIKQGRGK